MVYNTEALGYISVDGKFYFSVFGRLQVSCRSSYFSAFLHSSTKHKELILVYQASSYRGNGGMLVFFFAPLSMSTVVLHLFISSFFLSSRFEMCTLRLFLAGVDILTLFVLAKLFRSKQNSV